MSALKKIVSWKNAILHLSEIYLQGRSGGVKDTHVKEMWQENLFSPFYVSGTLILIKDPSVNLHIGRSYNKVYENFEAK